MWQVAQLAAVATWVAFFPEALAPLWQLAQLVAEVNEPWSGLAPLQVLVDLWQVSHLLSVVAKCVADLPATITPLWQLAHDPAATPVCLNLAPVNVLAVWQLSQAAAVGKCVADLVMLLPAKAAPAVWQVTQSRGVPLNTPLTWQDSHLAVVCAPVSGKPVFKWSKSRPAPWAMATAAKTVRTQAKTPRNTGRIKICIAVVIKVPFATYCVKPPVSRR
ncbi:MAG: hypothetical protein AUJ20_04740 [Comamonadaceae bacterium CG1_02_60_18]|nr:MAG: hypothetical protein AUJ20_04740 [Comamonadaceae bacterium CG1_02_60_18]